MSIDATWLLKRAQCYKASIPLVAIVVLGIALRLLSINNYLWSQAGYDESRDMLVARHIVEYRELIMRGPYASGAAGNLLTSPVYYWILALFWFIGRSPLSVAVLWSLLLSTIIILIYKATTHLLGHRAGILAASVAAIHPELIFISRQVHLPYLLALISCWVSVILSKRHVSLRDVVSVMLLLFLGINLHYAIFLFIPICILWLAFALRRLQSRYSASVFWIPIILAITCFGAWIFLTYREIPFDQFLFFWDIVRNPTNSQHSYPAINMFLELLWESGKASWTGALVLFFLAFLGLFFQRKYTPKEYPSSVWVYLLAITPIIFGSIYPGTIVPSYFISVLPMGIIICVAGLVGLTRWNKYVGMLGTGMLLIFFAYKSYYREIHDTPTISTYSQTQAVARAIYADRRGRDDTFLLAFLNAIPNESLNDWPTSSLYFTLEILYGKRLVRLIDTGTNFVSITQNPTHIYVVCDRRLLGTDASMDSCNDWMSEAQRAVQNPRIRLLYVKNPFMLWRLELYE